MEWWILRILWIFPLTWKSPNSSVFLIESRLQSQLQYILWLGAHFLAEGHSTSGKIPSSDMFACWYSVPKCVQLFVTPWIVACQAFLSFTVSWSLLRFMSIESRILSNHLILYHPLLILPSILASIRVFSNELSLPIRYPKYWSFSISPSNEYSGLISFRIDWFDFPDAQGTLKSLLQHHNLKASIFWHSGIIMIQLSHWYMTTGKMIALTRWTFLAK